MMFNMRFIILLTGGFLLGFFLSAVAPPLVNHEFSFINNGLMLTCLTLWLIIYFKYIHIEEDKNEANKEEVKEEEKTED